MSGETASIHPTSAHVQERRHNWFFVVLALLMLAIVVGGFTPTLYLRRAFGATDWALGTRSLPPHLLVHGVALTAWFTLFTLQAWLVAAGNTRWHRPLGMAGLVLAVAVVASSALTIVHLTARVDGWFVAAGLDPPEVPPMETMIVVVADSWLLLAFVLLVGAAVRFRHRPATHKRLMLFASLAILGPALSTNRPVGAAFALVVPQPLIGPLVFVGFLGALVWHDFATRRRLEPATVWGTIVYVAYVAGITMMLLGGSGIAYVNWLRD